ncbi:MAG: PAS domain S-box protein [Calditrichia bacterium]
MKTFKSPLQRIIASVPAQNEASSHNHPEILQEELLRSNARFQTLFDLCREAVLIINPDNSKILDVNKKTTDLLGYAKQEIIQQKTTFVFPKQLRLFRSLCQEAFKKQSASTARLYAVSSSGEKLPLQTTAWPIDYEGNTSILLFIEDLSVRMQTEQTLREYGTLIENMQEGLMIVDNDDVVRFVNPRICEMLGYSEDELIGKVGYTVLFNRREQKVIRNKNKLRTKRVSDQYEIQMVQKSGSLIWVSISGVPVTNSDGKVCGSFGIISDISERKAVETQLKNARDELEKRVLARTADLQTSEIALQRAKDGLEHRVEERTAELSQANRILKEQIEVRKRAEEQLLESEEKYRILFNSGNDVVLVYRQRTDGDLTPFIEVNDVACRKLGFSREELLKADYRKIALQVDESTFLSRLSEIQEERYLLYEDTFFTRSGNQIPVEVSAHLFDFKNKPTIMAIARDISARQRAAAQIREQAALLDKAQDAIMVCDLNDHIIYWNKSAERLYGWKMEEVIGTNAFELLFMNHSEQFISSRRSVLEHEEWQGELSQMTKEGKEIIVKSRWTLVSGNDGSAKSILVVNTDITEKRRIESQFLRAQRMESIGALAGGIAHDLNNVLAPILTAVQILQVRFDDNKSQRILDTIEANVKRGADMIKQILTFARGVEGERIPLQMTQILDEIRQIIEETFPRSVALESSIPRSLWSVSGDATQLHQVLLNLCVNARDAMPEGGELQLIAENQELTTEANRVHLDARPGPYVTIRVKDSGTGIPADIINKIFDPFFTTKTMDKGTGLGLSTVSAIVGSHGGFVNVNSSSGEGTTFDVYLPALVDFEAEEIIEEEGGMRAGKGEVILVVDDETSILEITRETLETYGYSVMLAHDGAEAVALYAQHQEAIPIVITDMMMPVMDGAATIRALRKINPHVKIIASSGYMEDSKISELLGRSVDGFLQKPYTAERLLETLHRVIGATRE